MHAERKQIPAGFKVITKQGEIGEVVEELTHDGMVYLHVRRSGPGKADLYIPYAAISRVVGNHVYLDLNSADLLGQAWHIHPGSEFTPMQG